jgi:predicted signal transduction protein with EAL and GGDEF domain
VSLENVDLHETVQREAVTDELTGLANHRRFQEALASELERARRFETGVGLVMLDVDDFKKVNDTHGHQVGDRVLKEVARDAPRGVARGRPPGAVRRRGARGHPARGRPRGRVRTRRARPARDRVDRPADPGRRARSA